MSKFISANFKNNALQILISLCMHAFAVIIFLFLFRSIAGLLKTVYTRVVALVADAKPRFRGTF